MESRAAIQLVHADILQYWKDLRRHLVIVFINLLNEFLLLVLTVEELAGWLGFFFFLSLFSGQWWHDLNMKSN